MITIDLATGDTSVDDILSLAEQQTIMLRTAAGKVFFVAEVDAHESEDDIAEELAFIRHNTALRELLAERSKEPGVYSLEEVRQKLGLKR
jgi:hypothetical protein